MTKNKIVLVPFPFDDLSSVKVRPALCLTNPLGLHRHVIIAFITSHFPADLQETSVPISMDEQGFDKTGLKTNSSILLHRLTTISTAIILRELGELPSHIQSQVHSKLKRLFSLK